MFRRVRIVLIAILVLLALLAASRAIYRRMTAGRSGPDAVLSSHLPRLDGAGAWLNGGPLTPDSLRGHPVAVVVWSDTDPECLAAMPEVEAWHEAYAPLGVRVVGVHAPEYSFAADSAVAGRAVRRLGLGFAVALDPALELEARLGGPSRGPRILVADTAGAIVFRGAGSARLRDADRALREQILRLHPGQSFPAGAEPADPAEIHARIVRLGSGRATSGPLATAAPGVSQTFTAQFRFQVEGARWTPYPVGTWTPSADGATAARGGAANFIAIRYDAGEVAAVLSPPPGGSSRLWILRDESWLPAGSLGEDAALDARGASYVQVTEPRLYHIAKGNGEHVLKLSPEDPGLTIHAFEFEGEPREH